MSCWTSHNLCKGNILKFDIFGLENKKSKILNGKEITWLYLNIGFLEGMERFFSKNVGILQYCHKWGKGLRRNKFRFLHNEMRRPSPDQFS